MTFQEIDKLVSESLKSKFPKTIRRDYYKLVKEWKEKDPNWKGDHDKTCGIMYLTEVDYDHYIDVRIMESRVRLTFRKDDSEYMDKTFDYDKFTKEILFFFLFAIDDYFKSDTLFDKFNSGVIPTEIIREYKLENIL